MTHEIEIAKKAAALEALTWVKPNMVIGLGTGSTTRYFIEALAESHLPVTGVATSKSSEILAKKLGLTLLNPLTVTSIDLTIDGADEVDPEWRMIKGGGGALLREKIAASISKQWIVIVDSNKMVDQLGVHPLPLEVLPWCQKGTQNALEDLGFKGKFRDHFITDNGNVIFDILLPTTTSDPETIEKKLIQVPGVLTTGFFFKRASSIIVGYSNQKTKTL